MDKARANLEAHGFSDTEEVTLYEAFTDVTVEPTVIGRILNAVVPVAHAQIYSRPEGYMTVWLERRRRRNLGRDDRVDPVPAGRRGLRDGRDAD